MNVPQTHLLEYLGAEEANLLVSMNLCKRDMDFFPKLDGLFQEPLKYIDLNVASSLSLKTRFLRTCRAPLMPSVGITKSSGRRPCSAAWVYAHRMRPSR